MAGPDVQQSLADLRLRLAEMAVGYLDGADLAEQEEVQDLFFRLSGLHLRHAAELERIMTERKAEEGGPPPRPEQIDAAVLRVRTLVTGFARNLLAGILQDEERIAMLYDEVTGRMTDDVPLWTALVTQRADLMREIATLRAIVSGPDRNNPQ